MSVNDDLHLSDRGRELLEEREGPGLRAYQDSVGVWTIGFGHTHFDGPPIPVRGMTISSQQQDEMLKKDIVRYENIVKANVHVPLKDHEFDALTSICYNVEAALSPKSSIVRCLNHGDREGAAHAIMLYVKPPEITHRRHGEYVQFLTPYLSSGDAAPPSLQPAA